jgi:cell division protein FtsW
MTIIYLAHGLVSRKDGGFAVYFITRIYDVLFLCSRIWHRHNHFFTVYDYYLAGNSFIIYYYLPVSVVGAIILIFAAPYRLRRLTAFLNPSEDPTVVGYHINQILISLSQGGVFGRGFGASRQKYMFLPEAHTDSIFAIFGEELGFVGSVVLISFYIFVLWKLYQVYESTTDKYGKLLIGGIFGFFGMQAVTNLGAMVGLLPLTGVPLPFISYGGSHILISFALIGIAINIAKSSKL